MEIHPQSLDPAAFAPFGDVIDLPDHPGRNYYDEALGNLRAAARPSLSITLKEPTPAHPLRATMLERHEFSSQTFIPIDVARWLIVVAPHAPQGGPDVSGVRAFIASGRQGVTYKPNTWHHGLTVLDRPAHLAVFMWRVGGAGDEEFVTVPPFTITLA
jgi:ureidoglycolate lyase